MIIEMARVRIAGPRQQLDPALRLLQDVGDLHLIAPAPPDGAAAPPPGLRHGSRATCAAARRRRPRARRVARRCNAKSGAGAPCCVAARGSPRAPAAARSSPHCARAHRARRTTGPAVAVPRVLRSLRSVAGTHAAMARYAGVVRAVARGRRHVGRRAREQGQSRGRRAGRDARKAAAERRDRGSDAGRRQRREAGREPAGRRAPG